MFSCFARCKIVDKHLGAVARKYADTKMMRLNAQEAPFFVTKLAIQVLPCIVMFKKGIACDRIVGFEELGGVDDFSQIRLEKRLTEQGIITYKNDDIDSDEEEELVARRGLKGGALYQGSKYKKAYKDNDESDEDW
jgi:thioredoxin-like negative regulator of GroEL